MKIKDLMAQDDYFSWSVLSMKKLNLGTRNPVPKYLLVNESQASSALERLYTPSHWPAFLYQ